MEWLYDRYCYDGKVDYNRPEPKFGCYDRRGGWGTNGRLTWKQCKHRAGKEFGIHWQPDDWVRQRDRDSRFSPLVKGKMKRPGVQG